MASAQNHPQEAAMKNAQRAMRLEVAILALREGYGDDPSESLIDLLTDARHWCDRNDQSFAELDRQAYQHYLTEIHAERSHTYE